MGETDEWTTLVDTPENLIHENELRLKRCVKGIASEEFEPCIYLSYIQVEIISCVIKG